MNKHRTYQRISENPKSPTAKAGRDRGRVRDHFSRFSKYGKED